MCDCSADVIQFAQRQGESTESTDIDTSEASESSVFLVMPPPTVRTGDTDLPAASASCITKRVLERAAKELGSQFSRYRLLKDLLEGEIDLQEAQPALALVLGFRATTHSETEGETEGGGARQMEGCAAYGWGGLSGMPDLTLLQGPLSDRVSDRLQADIPSDAELTDVAIEPLVGLEMYKLMKAGGRPEDVRRVLLAKWLYVHGFITQHAFPPGPGEVYVPRSLQEGEGDFGAPRA